MGKRDKWGNVWWLVADSSLLYLQRKPLEKIFFN